MMILAIAVAAMPVGHATNNVHTFFTNATTVGTCGTLCKGLSTTSGSASTSTVVAAAVEAAVPALDSGASSDKTGTCTTCGATISVTTWATTQFPDTVLVLVASSKTTASIQTAPSGTGLTCDAAVRNELLNSAGASTSEWVCHTTAAISSETVTCNIVGSPASAICEVIAINGAEDPTGTWGPFDKATGTTGYVCTGQRAAGGGTATPTTATGPSASCTSGQVTSLNANDFWIGIEAETDVTVQTVGNLGAIAATFIHTTTVSTTLGLSIQRRASSATTSAAVCGTFGTAESRWNIVCDALQAKPTYYKLEPETSASLTGTPSTAANGFSGTGWVFNTAGIQNGLNDIQAGTWQIDLKGAVGSPTGTPVARYFVTAWSCTTNSCTTATFLWNNWDTATNVASSTTQTAVSYTTASQASFASWSGKFLAIEVWVAWQYSGSTTSTTMTQTTIDTSMDLKTPGWDSTESLSSTVTIASALTHVTNIFKSLSASVTVNSALTHVTNIFKSLSASVTVNSALTHVTNIFKFLAGSLGVAGSETKGLARSLSGSLTLASSFAEKSSLFRSLTGSLSSSSVFAENSSLFRTLSGSLTIASSFVERSSLFRSLSGAFTTSSALTERSSLFRSLSGSLTLASGFAEQASLFRSLSGSLTLASSFSEKTSLFRSLSGTLSLAASETKGLAEVLTSSLGSITSLVEKSSLFRSLSGSLSLSGAEIKGIAKGMSASLSSTTGFAERSSLFRTLTGSLTLASSFVERSSLIRSLSGSLTLASSFAEKSSLFRSLSGS